ncbi:peroxide stress protein YaaA [Bengtsoniella intestinalis]|uniref:peroxide stress protein YaaA n=1 Tax=Bengtsoniella intestinalis TaxID=3073143 RepID=UPI00391F78D8
MRIIISPAKKMNHDPYCPVPAQLPAFLERTQQLKATLQAMDAPALQQLWKCNDSLAQLNVERLATMDLTHGLTPAIFSYEGIQYRYMAPSVMEESQLHYIQKHLRIVSGFYGLLRPLDGVTPYRLELQAKLAVGNHKNLYSFWGDTLSHLLGQETDCILNLASNEYSRGILPHLPDHMTAITCTFAQQVGEKLVEKGTMCKMARGQMVRWMAENHITAPDQLCQFDQLDYRYSDTHSSPTQLVFIQNTPQL